jgi:hypothetical protein
MLQEGVYQMLAGAPTVTAIIGTPADRLRWSQGREGTTGIFPGQMPEQAVLPALILVEISGETDVTLDGPSGLRNTHLQISCYGRSYKEAKNLAETVLGLYDGGQAMLPSGTEVDVSLVRKDPEIFEVAPWVYHAPLDVRFVYREPAAS